MLAKINRPHDIQNHKHYRLNYEHWLANLKDPAIQQNIAENFQHAETFSEAFTPEEIE